MKKIDINEVSNFIKEQSPETKIYIGCDSFKYKKGGVWYAKYTSVIVVHIDGSKGCSIWGDISTERDYDQNKKRPSLRLMNEVYKVSNLYLELAELVEDRDIEVHLDINPNEMHGSSCVVQQAIGYVKGVCGVMPLVKPDSWAASHAADRFRAY